MEQSEALKAAEAALRGLRESMEADGYLMHVDGLSDGTLAVRIEATADACEECLVQKELMGQMVLATLPANLGIKSVQLTYPLDQAH